MQKIIEIEHANNFARILRDERIRRNMTLEEMANFLGTTKQVLSRYERGERNPKLVTAALFAKKLDIPISYFENETEIDDVKSVHHENGGYELRQSYIASTLKKYEEIIDLFDSLPESKKQEAKNYLRYLSISKENK